MKEPPQKLYPHGFAGAPQRFCACCAGAGATVGAGVAGLGVGGACVGGGRVGASVFGARLGVGVSTALALTEGVGADWVCTTVGAGKDEPVLGPQATKTASANATANRIGRVGTLVSRTMNPSPPSESRPHTSIEACSFKCRGQQRWGKDRGPDDSASLIPGRACGYLVQRVRNETTSASVSGDPLPKHLVEDPALA
jgi:hypothetical protein